MRRIISCEVLCAIALLAVLPGAVSAAPALEPDWLVTVPGLQRGISAVVLRDVNADGIPEIFATDGVRVVLYDAGNDTTLFEYDFPSEWDIERVLAADVNRDAAVDIVVGGYTDGEWEGQDVIVAAFDGSSGFQQIDSMRHVMPVSWTYGLGESLKELTSADFDFDGEPELLVAFDSTYGGGSVGWTRGVTFCFDSFPDQVAFHCGELVSQMSPFTSATVDSLIVGVRHQNSFTEVGVDQIYISGAPSTFGPLGVPGEVMPAGSALCNPEPYYDAMTHQRTTYSWCAGDILESTPEAEVVSSQRASEDCTPPAEGSSDVTRVLAMHRLISRDSVELVWSREVPQAYWNLLWLPGHPGEFFGMRGLAVVRLAGIDGSEIGRGTELPPGGYFWAKPYADSIPRLVGYSGNEVAMYTLEEALDVDNAGETIVPRGIELLQNYPNPFNPSTTIRFGLSEQGRVRLVVQNVLGQEVRRLIDGELSAGAHEVQWDGRSEAGVEVASGVYVYRLVTPEGEASRKMVLMR